MKAGLLMYIPILVVFMLVGFLLSPVQSAAQSLTQGIAPSIADTTLSTAGKGHLRFPSSPFSQPNRSFLNRNTWQGYLNYGREAYETYTVSSRSFELYDRLGYRILRGYPLLTWQETRSKDPALQKSDIFRSQQYWQWFYSLTVLQDSYSGWDLGLMIGDNIRTTLTPMTLSTPRFDGVRLDGQSASRGFTLLLTRGQDRRFSTFQSQGETDPVLQYGGRWYSKIGDVLTTGVTFFNQHEADLFSGRGSFLHGTIPSGTEIPTKIFVRVQDDSPDDKTSSRIYSMDIYLNVLKNDGKRATLTSRSGVGPGAEYTPSLRPVVATGRRVGDHYEASGQLGELQFRPRLLVVDRDTPFVMFPPHNLPRP
ncbi:MAG: hypothetical protein HY709_10640, partial [Candidatus Latescibacteria bacterium]|nr:hypothetical protein [Candidatus Latescibacterota bacterium]